MENDMNDKFVEELLSIVCDLQQEQSNKNILYSLQQLKKKGAFVFVPETDAP